MAPGPHLEVSNTLQLEALTLLEPGVAGISKEEEQAPGSLSLLQSRVAEMRIISVSDV